MFLYQIEKLFLRTGIALCGKLFAAGNFSVVYMYTAEIYPTIIRFTNKYILFSDYLLHIVCIFVDKQPLGHVPWWQGLGE